MSTFIKLEGRGRLDPLGFLKLGLYYPGLLQKQVELPPPPRYYTRVAFGINFTKEIPLNEFCEILKFLLKKVRGGSILQKQHPFKHNLRKSQNFTQKVKGHGQFNKRIRLKRYFYYDFSKTHFDIGVFKIKSQLPKLISNFEIHNNVGDEFLLSR